MMKRCILASSILASSILASSLLLAPTLLFAQPQPANINRIAQNLKDALANLQSNPKNLAAQEKYLRAFPHTYKTFLALFGYSGEQGGPLYDGHEYILILPSFAEHHVLELGHLLVGLSKDAEYEADAPSYLQDVTVDYARAYTRSFVRLIRQLSPKQRSKLIIFLADMEAIAGEPRYQGIINNLKKLGEKDLAKQFELERTDRARLVDH
jgi:hypothetical protein